MSYVLVKVYCPHCATPNVKKNGVKANGRQNFYCKDCRRQFQFEYIYPGADPRIKRKVCEMAMNGSGIRDTARVLKISAMTVIVVLRLWFKTHGEPDFSGSYQSVMIDEMWTWVGRRKGGKRWLWYAYCGRSHKILAFQIGKRDDATCKKLMRKLAHLDIKHYYTDDWKSYKKHIPPEKHTVTKKKTQKIERQNLNFRTHIKRLCRKTICFSKKDDMHYGMLKAYIWHKNAA